MEISLGMWHVRDGYKDNPGTKAQSMESEWCEGPDHSPGFAGD